jgi:hypothetical protein
MKPKASSILIITLIMSATSTLPKSRSIGLAYGSECVITRHARPAPESPPAATEVPQPEPTLETTPLPTPAPELSMLRRLYNYFFFKEAPATPPAPTPPPGPPTMPVNPPSAEAEEKKLAEERFKEIDARLEEVNRLKANLAKTTAKLRSLKKEQDAIKEHPLMKLFEYSKCTMRYQKAYESGKEYVSGAKANLNYFSHEDDGFSLNYLHRKSVVQRNPVQVYDAQFEQRKHALAYKAADCDLMAGDKVLKKVINSSSLKDDTQTEYLDGIKEANFEYEDKRYFNFARKLGSISWQLLEYHNKAKFKALLERRNKVGKMIASLQTSHKELQSQYHDKLESLLDTINSRKDKFGLTVSPQCLS